jgi:hypothetical protein
MAMQELDDNLPVNAIVDKLVTGPNGEEPHEKEVVPLRWIIRVKGYLSDDGDGFVITHVTPAGPASNVVNFDGSIHGPLGKG